MQVIVVNSISQSVKGLHDKYRFQSAHTLNRWIFMNVFKAAWGDKKYETTDEEIAAIAETLPDAFNLPQLSNQDAFTTLLSEVTAALMAASETIFTLTEAYFDLLVHGWVQYVEVDPDNYAIIISDDTANVGRYSVSANPPPYHVADEEESIIRMFEGTTTEE